MNKRLAIILTLIFVVIVFLAVLFLFVFSSFFNNLFNSNVQEEYPIVNGILTPEEFETKFINNELGISFIIPENWRVIEDVPTIEIISASGEGSITLEAFEDESFSQLTQIDKFFCEGFEQGFREGIGVDVNSDKFLFEFFSLNGNMGCRSEGEIIPNVRQKYYVFFNENNKKVISVFYTSANPQDDEALERVLNSFVFID